MKQAQKTLILPLIVVFLLMQGCATSFVGKAEQTTQVAADTFNAFVTYERQVNPLPVSDEAKQSAIHQYAQLVRKNAANWLQSARALTEAYRLNPTKENESDLNQIMAVIAAAQAQSNLYLGHK